MITNFDLAQFIYRHVTQRETSLFEEDILANETELKQQIQGKSALVIGGAGSIGSSFIKSLLRFNPARLIVVDINENGLTELTRDLRSTEGLAVPARYLTYPINFGDAVFAKILRREGPFDIVANFAAHKHVRSEKDQYSIEAMVENNVLKAGYLLELLMEQPPSHFFCVSTDKAANPVNIMGASKKLMEEVILSYSRQFPITTARFANVAFSNGSLPAGFMERLMKRQPLSAPSDVKRYFVSPEESGQICLLACVLGKPGEIFFPKLNEANMRRFSDIAEALLRELGYEPHHCQSETEAKAFFSNSQQPTANSHRPKYPVYFFQSDTSGEKSFEEFYTEEEELDMVRFKALGVIKNAPCQDLAEIEQMFVRLKELFNQDNLAKHEIVDLMGTFIPNFEHIETGKGLDQKM
ncbi:MAG: NAD-dependent epimerase/dehydratase family protein [Bacteroidetes bacterium]|nr:NAD-dependent epimerase/dehydratase family protein [Bacteroidota bacterium]